MLRSTLVIDGVQGPLFPSVVLKSVRSRHHSFLMGCYNKIPVAQDFPVRFQTARGGAED